MLVISAAVFFVFADFRSVAAQETDGLLVGWRTAAGPVASYDVYVEQNGGELAFYDNVSGTGTEISGPRFARGDALRFEVRARSADGRQGQPSEISDFIFFEAIPVPVGLVAEPGSRRDPNRIQWDAVEHAEFYVIFRSLTPGLEGEFLGQSEVPLFEDFEAEPGTTHYYAVAAVAGSSASDVSAQVAVRRGDAYPRLVATPAAVAVAAGPIEINATASIALSNDGDWELAYATWTAAPWLSVSPSQAIVDESPELLTLTFAVGTLRPGDYESQVLLYTYYQPPAGEEFVLAPPLVVDVHLTITDGNAPPVIESAPLAGVSEGEVLVFPIRATDPDRDDVVEVAVGSLPPFASFENFGNGEGQLTLTPGFEAAGTYGVVIAAWDDGVPVEVTFKNLSVVVVDRNRPPTFESIPSQTISVGQTVSLLLSAADPDVGDLLAITSSSLPAFVNLVDHGDGSADLSLAPGLQDVGSYVLALQAVDDGTPSRLAGITLTVLVVP